MKLKSGTTIIEKINLEKILPGTVIKQHLHIMDDGMGMPVALPIFVAKGVKEGPVLGLTAAVHGNELNGVKVIHKLINEIEAEVEKLSGTVIAVPIVNVPGTLRTQRYFNDGIDLNRIMPGKSQGNASQQYVSRFIKQVVKKFDYLLDLHTASFGRVNSFYVRADMDHEVSATLAKLQNPQIIVHNKSKDGSLRGAAEKLKIPAITVEVGDPQRFQPTLIKDSLIGIYNIICHLKMLPMEVKGQTFDPVYCKKSYWIHTDCGGFLEVYPNVTDRVEEGQKIARLVDVFGHTIKEYHSPADGIVVGKSTNPISQTGARILHLGIE